MIAPIANNSLGSVQAFDEVQTNVNDQGGTYNQDGRSVSTLTHEPSSPDKAAKSNDKESLNVTDMKTLSNSLKNLINDDTLTIEFSMDKNSRKMILKLIDNKTGDLIQQFPPEIALKIARIAANNIPA
jgi:uncharacterized FlaG/YvyC family protein